MFALASVFSGEFVLSANCVQTACCGVGPGIPCMLRPE